ncbi:hypothetical protein CDD81_4694 [Ophiocordyceps australis]|uniref:Uncharacterized protein n=1 Tax=Ophiocordyceps australis TaxID=1399860 RepID=A0A2C5Y6K8_9HYPO|nr:hypothetical protein CDD81_4694 [Ophiocordyceps australis]
MEKKMPEPSSVQIQESRNIFRNSQGPTEDTIEQKTEADPRTKAFATQYGVGENDIIEAEEFSASMSVARVIEILKDILSTHDDDPNFPYENLQSIKEFLAIDDILEAPEKHEQQVQEMKLLVAFIINNSPYAQVRAVVDNHDDPNIPVSTIRAWLIGIFFSILLPFVNQLFSIRQPSISFPSHVAQLLAFPIGKSWEKWMPDYQLPIPFTRKKISLNPGRFNKKEHMLITIMAGTSAGVPITNFVIWMQVLPQYLNQQYAKNFGYILLNSLATAFIGYGLAGIVRRFLVYPTHCVWPLSLATIALNGALHHEENQPIAGPFNRIWTISRYLLAIFSWMTWISPNNRDLDILTGMQNGVGLLNPIPTLDWNIITTFLDPLVRLSADL